jgi:hypothetical protein
MDNRPPKDNLHLTTYEVYLLTPTSCIAQLYIHEIYSQAPVPLRLIPLHALISLEPTTYEESIP